MNKRKFGSEYEQTVADYLQKQGYELLKKNYNTPYGEADLIMKDKDEFVFVEVKARRTLKYGLPAEAVTKSKQKKYLLTSQYFFMTEYPDEALHGEPSVRFDVAQIYIKEGTPYINYIRNAFDFTDSDTFY